MVALEHERAALAELVDLRVERARDHADEARHDEEAAEGDHEHQDAEEPALVAAHRAGVEGAHEAAPHHVEELPRRAHAEDEHEHADDDDEQQGERASSTTRAPMPSAITLSNQ